MLISIVIPTRDRAQYLRHSLATATAIDDPDIEILVSDNASVDETRKVVSDAQDPRVRYVNTGARVSMRQNFEFARQHASGDYLIYFGDDDGVLSQQFCYLRRILEAEKPDVLSWPVSTYLWRVNDENPKAGFMRLRCTKIFGRTYDLDPGRYRADLLACNLKRMTPFPNIYHGCASREYLEKTSSDKGVYFNGSIPDYYFSYVTILHGGRFVHADHPFTISGQSPASTGASQGTKRIQDSFKNPGTQFGQEIQKDEIKDVVGYALSVPLALFSSVETARDRFPELAGDLDYRAWYGYVLKSTIGRDEELAQSIRDVLRDYAEKTGTLHALETAVPKEIKRGRSLKSRWDKAIGSLTSRKIDMGTTIYSAISTLDGILGQDYGEVLDGKKSQAQGWRSAKARSNTLTTR
jgi:hypothetical protein